MDEEQRTGSVGPGNMIVLLNNLAHGEIGCIKELRGGAKNGSGSSG